MLRELKPRDTTQCKMNMLMYTLLNLSLFGEQVTSASLKMKTKSCNPFETVLPKVPYGNYNYVFSINYGFTVL